MGGKALLVGELLPLIPEHECYCEVFGGGAALLLNKPRSRVEVLNDINGELVNFYRCLRFHGTELRRQLRFFLNSREEFEGVLSAPGLTDIQRAVGWFFRNANSFGGKGQHFAAGRVGGGGALTSRVGRLRGLAWLQGRLDRVAIERLDWRKCLERYDGAGTFFFLDPPYWHGTQYDPRWDAADHGALREWVEGLKGRWVLTYDDCPEIRELWRGCCFRQLASPKGIGNNHGKRLGRLMQVAITKPLEC